MSDLAHSLDADADADPDREERFRAFLDDLDAPASPQDIAIDVVPLSHAASLDPATIEESDPDQSDMVQAMQQLLLKHEDTSLHRVEDPDLKRVLDDLRILAHSNIADVFASEQVLEWVGVDAQEQDVYERRQRLRVRDVTTLPRDVSACIQSIKMTRRNGEDVVEVKMYDRQVSLDKLMRFHGAYMRDNEQQARRNDGVIDLLLASIGSTGLPTIENNDA